MKNLPLMLLATALLAACATVPNGPTVLALPGSSKSFEQFRADDGYCRQYALDQIGGVNASQAARQSAVQSAAVGTAVGALAGAALGGHQGAGAGAAGGLIVGSMAGSDSAARSSYGTQRQYDNAYIQCMYAHGQKVPVSPAMAQSLQQAPAASAPPAPGGYLPPPPPPR